MQLGFPAAAAANATAAAPDAAGNATAPLLGPPVGPQQIPTVAAANATAAPVNATAAPVNATAAPVKAPAVAAAPVAAANATTVPVVAAVPAAPAAANFTTLTFPGQPPARRYLDLLSLHLRAQGIPAQGTVILLLCRTLQRVTVMAKLYRADTECHFWLLPAADLQTALASWQEQRARITMICGVQHQVQRRPPRLPSRRPPDSQSASLLLYWQLPCQQPPWLLLPYPPKRLFLQHPPLHRVL